MANSFNALFVGVLVSVSLLLAVTLANATDWTDFSGTCLHPASVPANAVLVFTSPAKVLKAIKRYEQDQLGATCGQEFAESFARLKWVLDEVVLSDICGQEAYERIRAFHLEFIHFYVPELGRDQLSRVGSNQNDNNANGQSGFRWFWQPKPTNELSAAAAANSNSNQMVEQIELKPIPKALRYFFINFAKQANAQCKEKLIERLEPLQRDPRKINPDDFDVLAKYKQESMKLSFLYELTKVDQSSYGHEKISDFNRLEIVDFERQVANEQRFKAVTTKATQSDGQTSELQLANGEEDHDDDDDDGSKLYIQVPFDDKLKRIKEACRKRFMPIYMELFTPVIRLNNLGYIDRENSQRVDQALDEQEHISRWFVIIQTCEVLKDIEILHDASASNAIRDLVLASSHLAALKQQERHQEQRLKLLSRREADQLKATAQREQIRPLYDPPVTSMEHESCNYSEIMWLREAKKVQSQVREFERDVSRMISRKTSVFSRLKRDLKFNLKRAFSVGKRQVLERDETSTLGKLAVFIERHQNLIRGFGLIMSLIVMTLSLTG